MAYQILGWEFLDWMQNVDFYYGELLEHKAHYDQLKRVDPKEIENRLKELIDKLSKVTVLTDERDKHINKAREILRRGW
jgi:LmbE family N-acetylglucosaminyl deacetylase